jgi:hypothetical protein
MKTQKERNENEGENKKLANTSADEVEQTKQIRGDLD